MNLKLKWILKLTSPIKYLLIVYLFFAIGHQLTNISGIIIPVKQINKEFTIEKNLEYLGAPKSKVDDLTQAVKIASDSTNLKEELIVAIIKTESNFKNHAVSYKKYKGLMQTPTATFIYSDVDVLHGARILKDKLRITNGNLLQALTLYKGGNNSIARRYAIETLDLYKDLLEKNQRRKT
jgi:soluble lytic murein transglycosylase-like protein